ncbi:MAG: hypothetical protein HY860_06925 [Chlamydiales bacterium]|nr:hypothetical protein [Chlamydiales bacterium]
MKKLLFLLIFPCLVFSLDKDYIIITLGENCVVTGSMELLKIKQESYPFEWNICSFSSVYECIKDDFKDFTNPDYFTPYIDNRSPVNRYGICLAHNFPIVLVGINKEGIEVYKLDPNWRHYLPAVQEKYQRRIDRFRHACLSDKKVFFIRYPGVSKVEATQFSKLISSLYPDLDFTFLSVNINPIPPREKEQWNIPHVKLYYITPSTSEKECTQWKEIMTNVGVLH